MARIEELTPEQETAWADYLAGLPEHIRLVAERFFPLTLYRLRPTGQRVLIYSFNSTLPITITVDIPGEYNLQLHNARVFGIDPNDLEECDLPGPDEALGNALTPAQVNENIDALRVMVRPDLWIMGEDSTAKRRS